ncbi:MAG: glycoside hydrolase family 27 protein [Lentisphaerae bacterium]|jgi:alpha-galactosidase|nr:glycoside hydrolase family 27 protein [Lentisphaerota bacterium]MBT4817275.1 glycoside hydrolase family 27 protein [Lentisphaerota bacterium]MBT5606615.1 glycoside hydrolase family 27 protein [Lentisphaerota bacterium]MBT7059542.1 glycoside hydrolase family 27 protein [Lentisphaerota bacterium]MBT7843021.1 glycoside hydrolase family 27 protein [Lentisphaerota bacterium]
MPDLQKLAPRPPLGWNSYDCFNCNVTEDQVRQTADIMALYLKPLGYQYVVVDYCWYYPYVCNQQCPKQREGFLPALCIDEFGRYLPAVDRFPSAADGSGFTALAAYVHSKGLKLGIHVMRGIPKEAAHRRLPIQGAAATADQIAQPETSCKWLNHNFGVNMAKPGAQEYYDSVFRLYAGWGVDYVKVDDMVHRDPYLKEEIEAVHDAVSRCGKPMVLSLSAGGSKLDEETAHLQANSHLWRISQDIWDDWNMLKQQFAICEQYQGVGRPHGWPDADMLTIGKLSLNASHGPDRYSLFSDDEAMTMLTLWWIFRSPLMIGGDLRQMRTKELDWFCNAEALAANQYGEDPRQVFRTEHDVAWFSDAPEAGAKFVALFNVSDEKRTVAVKLEDLEIKGTASVRDLWQKRDLADCSTQFSAEIAPHGAGLYKLTPTAFQS